MQKGVKIMKYTPQDPGNMPVFNDPYLTDTNQPQDRAVRREHRMINFWVKQAAPDVSAPMSTGEKIRRGILIFLGICVAVAVILIGIYMIRNFGELGTTGGRFF